METSKWHNKFFVFPYISINVEKLYTGPNYEDNGLDQYDVGLELGWFKWSVEFIRTFEI